MSLPISIVAGFLLLSLSTQLERPRSQAGRRAIPVPASEKVVDPKSRELREVTLDTARALLKAGFVEEVEDWAWGVLQGRESWYWDDASQYLLLSLKRQGRLHELEGRILELRSGWLQSVDTDPQAAFFTGSLCESAHVALSVARSIDEWSRWAHTDRLWGVFAERGKGFECTEFFALHCASVEFYDRIAGEFAPTAPLLREGGESRAVEASLRDTAHREVAFEHLLAFPDWLRAHALQGLGEDADTAAVVALASLHDPRVRPRLGQRLEETVVYPYLFAWWYLLLAIEGSTESYDLIRAGLELPLRKKSASVILELVPEGRATVFSFALELEMVNRLEAAGAFFSTCGRERFFVWR